MYLLGHLGILVILGRCLEVLVILRVLVVSFAHSSGGGTVVDTGTVTTGGEDVGDVDFLVVIFGYSQLVTMFDSSELSS